MKNNTLDFLVIGGVALMAYFIWQALQKSAGAVTNTINLGIPQ
jgi:hypothetical protein